MYRKKTIQWLVSLLSFLLVFSSIFANPASAAGNDRSTSKKGPSPQTAATIQQSTKNEFTQRQKTTKPTSSSSQTTSGNFEADELIIQYKNTAASATLKNKHSLKTERRLSSIGAEVVKVTNGENVQSLVKMLKADPSVAFVQPNYKYRAADLPNDPSFNKLWGLHNTGQVINGTTGVNDIDIDYPEAIQEFSKGTQQQVIVGVIDTGIDINHPDLIDNIWTNPGEIANNGKDDDGNGYIDDVHGWDFYHSDNSVYDALDGDDHGTHVAGTIAAKGNNGIGVTGIAPNVKIMPLKFLGPDGSGSTADAILAIEYAKKFGVKITNNSWEGTSYDQALKNAIDKSGMLIVAAAGNDGLNNDQEPGYPASFDSPNIISVAAINNSGNLASFSNYGSKSVDIAAPGTNILSTVPRKIEHGTGAEINNNSYHYKAIFNGFGFEHFTAADRQAAFSKAISYLGLTTASKILLVQDDETDVGNVNYLSVYTTLLNNAGLSYSIKTVGANQNGPSLSTLSGYDSVIWFTGNAMGQDNPNLTSTDLSALEQFLKKGNKSLLLSGEDLLYRNEDSYFVKNILALTIIGEGETRDRVNGAAGTAYDSASYGVTYAPYADYITSSNETVSKVNLIFPAETAYDTAYEYMNGTSMATPHVTGVAALLAGKYPAMSLEKLKATILASGDDAAALSGKVLTGKILNARNALIYTPQPIVNNISDKDTTVTGQAEAGSQITVSVSGLTIGEGLTGTDGRFTVGIPAQTAGAEVVVTSTNQAGNVSAPVTLLVRDSTAPVKPVVNEVSDKDTTVTGQAEAGSKIEVKISDLLIGGATVDSSGRFIVTIPVQKAGTELMITAVDNTGNISEAATVVVKDTTTPSKPIVNKVSDIDTTVSGLAEAGSKVEVKVNGTVIGFALAGTDGKFTITIPAQKAGTELTITATDQAGNVSEAAIVMVADETAPIKPVVNEVTDKDTVVTGQSETGFTIEVKVNGILIGSGVTGADGKFSVTIPVQKAGTELSISAVDQTGNVSEAVIVIVKDTTAPAKPVVNDVTDKDTTVTGQAEAGSKVEVKVNGTVIGFATAGSDGKFTISISSQKAGTELVITATDKAGNVSEAVILVVKDLTAPAQPVVNDVTDKDTTVTGQAEAGSKVEVKVNGTVIGFATAGSDGKFTIPIPVQNAGTELIITATDSFGNTSSQASITVKATFVVGWNLINSKWYYYNSEGIALTGWQKIGGKWYYFDQTGTMLTGWLKSGSSWYYLESSGAMKTGWIKLGTSWYFLDGGGVLKIGWFKSGTSWYYSNSNGVMMTGWVKVGYSWYYLYSDGRMAYSTIIQGCKLNANGVWVK